MLFEPQVADPAYRKMDVPGQAPWQGDWQAGNVVEYGPHPRKTFIFGNNAEERAGAASLKAGGTLKERAVKKRNKMPANNNPPHVEDAKDELDTIQAANTPPYLDELRVLACAAHGGAGAALLTAGEAVQEPAVMNITNLSANYNVPRPKEDCVMAFAMHGGAGAAYLKAGGTLQEPAVLDTNKMSAMCDVSRHDENVPAKSTAPDLFDEGVTTVMFDVPCRLTQEQLMNSICDLGFADTFDFLYVPSRKKSNRGYAYVNFLTHDQAVAFGKALPGYTFPDAKHSMKTFAVKAAHTQGKEANILRNIQGKVLPYIRDPPAYVLQSWARNDTVIRLRF